jgi:DNA-binding NtrC family response regulator
VARDSGRISLKPVVVVISRNDDTRAALRRIFREIDWSIRERRSVASFGESVPPAWSGLVLTDYTLGDGTWRDVAEAAEAHSPNTRVIVMSRVADDYMWAEVLNCGAFDLISQQPVDRAEVVRTAAAALRHMHNAGAASAAA